MIIAQLLALVATAAILAVFVKIGTIAVSAPNSSLLTVAAYSMYRLVVYLGLELLGVQKPAHFLPPLIELHGVWIFLCLTTLIILSFWITMRLFDIGKLRAFCFMIAVSVLMTLTGRLLTSGLSSL
jgi:hypothetical protein